MAVSEIHAIRCTPERLIQYIMKDKIEKISSKGDAHKDCEHEFFQKGKQLYVRYKTNSLFQSCSITNPISDFTKLQKRYQFTTRGSKSSRARSKSDGEPLAWHCRVSFRGRECSPEVAEEFAQKLSEEVFTGFPVVMSVHTNTDNIHLHFAVSAWSWSGKKWHNCHATTQQIRDVTDRLCNEYGLSVLHETSRMNLTHTRNMDGTTRIWEPTPRKIELAKMREQDINYPDDVNSYRNSPKYRQWKNDGLNHSDVVKRDIDALLPQCKSYDDLLNRLRLMGYKIRAKRKDGSWLTHVAYTAPDFERAVREDRIGDGVFYLHDNLVNYIQNNKQKAIEAPRSDSEIPFFSDFKYSKVDISEIRDDFYKIQTDNGIKVKPRTNWQRKAISSIKADDFTARQLLDSTALRVLALEQEKLSFRKQKMRENTEAEKCVARIVDTFRALRSAEYNDFRTYGQMLDTYKNVRKTYDSILHDKQQCEKLLADRKFVMELPVNIQKLELRIEKNKGNIEYVLEKYQDDAKLLAKLKMTYDKMNLGSDEALAKFKQSTLDYQTRLDKINLAISDAEQRLLDVENCFRTYARIDSEHGIDVRNVATMFEKLTHGEYDSFEQNYGRYRSELEHE